MNLTLTAAPCSVRTSRTQPWSRGTSAPFRRTTCRAVRFISSPGSAGSGSRANGRVGAGNSGRADFLAKMCRVPGEGQDSMGSDPVCGSSGCGLFGHEDPFGCSLRTSLVYELAAMTGYTMRWTRSVTPSGRSWWALRLSARLIDETESGLWPTVMNREHGGNAMDGGSHSRKAALSQGRFPTPNAWGAHQGAESRETKAKRNAGGVNLREACNWPTAQSADGKRTSETMMGGNPTLRGEALWCSPNASPAEAGSSSRSGNRIGELLLAGQCRRGQPSTNGKRRGSLNPAWVSQLMGYPDGWLDLPAETLCKLSATPSFRKSRRRSCERG